MHKLFTTLFLSAATTTAALAQNASFTPFGAGCTFDNQTLAIGNQGLPQLGTTCTITYSGPNHTHNFAQQIAWPQIGLGFNQSVFPIPQSILPQQPAGCMGLISADVMIPMPVDPVLPQYQDHYDFVIPNATWLIGVNVYAQWLMLHTQCGFVGCNYDAIATSDAALMTIGL
ncbi:MAG: hypothetical protein H6838_08020 [Planctomycetes bacterium]|nr:hypothetical protein [Planctomycetota bacterium]MCB9885423.1 hypothetical protein [Planctomycetota bacterium]